MKRQLIGTLIGAVLACAGDITSAQDAPPARPAESSPPRAKPTEGTQTPIGNKWWPSRWGADDQRGAANLLTPERTLAAARLITQGKVYSLGRTYESEMPVYGRRTFRLLIPAFRKVMGDNMLVSRDEFVAGEIGQVGTQFDGLGHVGCRLPDGDTYYNGHKSADLEEAYGLKNLGIENATPFFTRGVLVDLLAARNVDRLAIGHEVSTAELEATLRRQNLRLRPGDVVLLRTGHGKLWMKDNDTYKSGEPGIGLDAARWLIKQDVAMVGADTWGIEVHPGANTQRPFEVHQWMLTKNGIYLIENLDLEALAADKVYEFAFIFAPLKLKGATGSPGNPIAVR